MATTEPPSFKRRQELRQADAGNSIQISSNISLERYYQIATTLVSKLNVALDEMQLDQAYVYGIRFLTLVVQEIPKHSSYSTTLKRKRTEMTKKADVVLKLMDQVAKRMDAQELVKQKKLEEEEETLKQQKQKEEEEKIKQQQQKEEETKLETKNRKEEMEKKALAKLSAMQSKINEASKKASPPKKEETKQQGNTTSSEKVDEKKEEEKDPPPKQQEPLQEEKHDPLSVKIDTTFTNQQQQEEPTKEEEEEPKIIKTPRRLEEEETIRKLEAAIDSQLEHLEKIEMTLIPLQKKKAKQELQRAKLIKTKDKKKNPHRKAALHCVAQKRQLQQQSETIKAAVFTMETQLFLLETAMEDRQVTLALEEANQAMKGLSQSVGVQDLENLGISTLSNTSTIMEDDKEDDQELLQELEEWIDTTNIKSVNQAPTSTEDDDFSILSLPNVPDQQPIAKVPTTKKKSIRNLLKAVF